MTTTPIPEAVRPKCPHCKTTMETVDGYSYTLGAFVILTVACSHCTTLLHMGIMPPRPPAPEPEEPKSPLWKPQ